MMVLSFDKWTMEIWHVHNGSNWVRGRHEFSVLSLQHLCKSKIILSFFLRVSETLMFSGWSLPPVQCHGFIWSKPHLLREPRPAWYRCQSVVNVECHSFHAKLGTRAHLTLAVRVLHISTWPLTGLQETRPHPKHHLSWSSTCKLGWVFTTSEPHLFCLASLGAP